MMMYAHSQCGTKARGLFLVHLLLWPFMQPLVYAASSSSSSNSNTRHALLAVGALVLAANPAQAQSCPVTSTNVASNVICATESCEGNNACSDYTCSASTCTLDNNSCGGENACQAASSTNIGFNSCLGGFACARAASPTIGSFSCVGDSACSDAFATIGDDSCKDGFRNCATSTGPIGDGSCTGAAWACISSSATIDDGSCNNGISACRNTEAPSIGINSCNDGDFACFRLPGTISVGDNSCNGGPHACSGDDLRAFNGNVDTSNFKCPDPKGDGTVIGDFECNVDSAGHKTCCTQSCTSDSDCENILFQSTATTDFRGTYGPFTTLDCQTFDCGCKINAGETQGRCQKLCAGGSNPTDCTFALSSTDALYECDVASSPSFCARTANGGAMTDPHFETLSGETFDFQGECDLVLLRNAKFSHGVGLEIHARTTRRSFYSFIEAVGIKIGDHIMSVDNNGTCRINGKEHDTESDGTTFYLADFAVLHELVHGLGGKKNKFTVTTGEHGEGLSIVVWDVFVSVNVIHAYHTRLGEFEDSSGMIGSDMVGRNGTSLVNMDPSEFAREWQVRPGLDPVIFDTARAPQYPDTCLMPDPAVVAERHLGNSALLEMADLACEHWGAKKEDCIYDVVATGNLGLATAF